MKLQIEPKKLVISAMVAAGLVAVAAILDLAIAMPFGRAMVFDILFLISAALVLYLSYETYREIT